MNQIVERKEALVVFKGNDEEENKKIVASMYKLYIKSIEEAILQIKSGHESVSEKSLMKLLHVEESMLPCYRIVVADKLG